MELGFVNRRYETACNVFSEAVHSRCGLRRRLRSALQAVFADTITDGT
jgi:hypothetical protein